MIWRSETDAPDAQPTSEESWEKQHTSPFLGNESEPLSACGAGTQFQLFLLQRSTLWQEEQNNPQALKASKWKG